MTGLVCVNQVVELQINCHHLGVLVHKSCTFGDNDSVVNSSDTPDGKLAFIEPENDSVKNGEQVS